jgi:hypothetical protein
MRGQQLIRFVLGKLNPTWLQSLNRGMRNTGKNQAAHVSGFCIFRVFRE